MLVSTVLRFRVSMALLCSCFFVHGQRNITTPLEPSLGASAAQTVGISTVTVKYSRPAVKGRVIWGGLVPYGYNVDPFGARKSAPWRSGANENTVLTLSHPATIEGHLVPAGQYGLFFVIYPDNTGEVVLSRDYRSWGSFYYDSTMDQMRAKITVRDLSAPVERLTYSFDIPDRNTAELDLSWEKKQFPVKITFAVDDIVMANAVEELKNVTGFSWQGYSSAANYALQHHVNAPQAIEWADRAVAMNKSYTTLRIKAGLLKQSGDAAGADKLMGEASALASELELNQYGYELLAENQFPKAIEVFKMNTASHPSSANAWDSQGEGYALAGDKKNAILSFKKALTLNPPPPTKANSEKYLKQLGTL